MPNLILRPSTLIEGKPWALQLRDHGPVETTYHTIARLSDEAARDLAKCDNVTNVWLFGEPKIECKKSEAAPDEGAAYWDNLGATYWKPGMD